LLDEPTEGIQPNIIQQIGHVLDYLKAKGDMAIVLVEQYFDFAWGPR
jgi:urea transport system ATP-binding protein